MNSVHMYVCICVSIRMRYIVQLAIWCIDHKLHSKFNMIWNYAN